LSNSKIKDIIIRINQKIENNINLNLKNNIGQIILISKLTIIKFLTPLSSVKRYSVIAIIEYKIVHTIGNKIAGGAISGLIISL
jgi:hypothetical protein